MCAGCVYILCVYASVCVCVPEEDCVSMCPLGCVLCECVFALSVLLYPCVLKPVCSYVRVSAIQALCVSRSSFACPAGVLASTSRRVRSVCPRESSSEGVGREGEVGVSPLLHPPAPLVPHPHSLSPGIEPYLESRFDICFQI